MVSNKLQELGLKNCIKPYLCITPQHSTFILVYFDDILVTGSNDIEVQKLIDKLHDHFTLKDLGLVDYFLGIQVKQTSEGLHRSHTRYITDLLSKGKMQIARSVNASMTSRLNLTAFGSDVVENV